MKHQRSFLARVAISFAAALFSLVGRGATTNMWYPSTSASFSGWPTNWIAIPSLNDQKNLTALDARLDFVGDSYNPGAYWSSDTNYFFIRMRVAVSNVTSTTFRDAHWVYIDRAGFTNGTAAAGMPDYALVWDSKNNDPSKHGLELMTGSNLVATTYWSQMTLNDIDSNTSQKIAPPDFNLTGDGYLRTIDMRPTTNFGYTTFIDFAVKWSFIRANTSLSTNQSWRLQFGSRNDANDHNFPQDDIAGGFSPGSVVSNSWSSFMNAQPLSSAINLSAFATGGGVQIDLWTVDEQGSQDIVVYVWRDGDWAEVGRVPADEVVGEGSNHYVIQTGDLVEGGIYAFRVIDECGHEFVLNDPITVNAIRMHAVEMTPSTLSVSFNTVQGGYYCVKASPSLSAPKDQWVTECVSHPTSKGWSGLTGEPFMAGPGEQTQVKIPRNSAQMFYRIEKIDR